MWVPLGRDTSMGNSAGNSETSLMYHDGFGNNVYMIPKSASCGLAQAASGPWTRPLLL